ncbi:MAG: hypothetical protein AAGA48_40950 [Myxococcota bacterium]
MLFGWWMLACSGMSEDAVEVTTEPTEESIDLADWVSELPGTWLGNAETPMGSMPFAMEGEATEMGVRTSIERSGLLISLAFTSTPDGWVLTERGELPGGFVQQHDLVPVSIDGSEVRFLSIEEGLMDLVTSVEDGTWDLEVDVRGLPHVSWTLQRL